MFGHRYDKVICDVPCSGDGTLRRRPHCWKSWSMEFLLHREGSRVHMSSTYPRDLQSQAGATITRWANLTCGKRKQNRPPRYTTMVSFELRKGKKVDDTISALEIRGFSLDIAQQAAADLVPWPSPFTSWRALGVFDLQHEPNRKWGACCVHSRNALRATYSCGCEQETRETCLKVWRNTWKRYRGGKYEKMYEKVNYYFFKYNTWKRYREHKSGKKSGKVNYYFFKYLPRKWLKKDISWKQNVKILVWPFNHNLRPRALQAVVVAALKRFGADVHLLPVEIPKDLRVAPCLQSWWVPAGLGDLQNTWKSDVSLTLKNCKLM